MISHLTKILILIIASLGLVSCGVETQKSDILSIPSQSPATGSLSALAPEPRQMASSVAGHANSPVYPYNLYQNSVYGSSYGPQTPSSATNSMLSFFRPNQGGRRSSLTSRLRNLMNAIFFRRETSSPYLASGSSYSYTFRQPPYGFSSGMPSGYSSGFTSGMGSQAPNFLAAASGYRPIVFPSYQGSGSTGNSAWSNYKQWASSSLTDQGPYTSSLNSQLGTSGGANYAWNSSPSSSSYSGLSSALSNYAAGTGSNSGYQSSGATFQASASNTYPSSSYSSVSYQPSNTSYKRSSSSSSSSNFKPVVNNSYANGPIVASSSSVVSSSSSYGQNPSSNNPSSNNYKP